MAGAESRYGREARSEFDENLAPITADNAVLGSTITMMARNIGKNIPFFPPKWIKDYRNIEEIGINRDIYPPNGENFQGFWWMELSEPYHQINDFNSMRDELLKYVLGVWNYVKNYSDQKEAVKNYALEWIGMLPGKRESRRLMGEVIINQKDCQTDRQWEDRVCFAGWFLDEHIKNGILNKTEPPELSHIDENYANYVMVSPYTIPLRALYSKNISNLWMAGRNISMSHIALCSIRVQNTLGNIGQAVGTAAAYSIKNNLLPYQLLTDSLIHIKNIQQKLIMDDVRIPGIENEDETDLARSAHIISSSSAILDFGQVNTGEFVPLDYPLSQIIPVTENYVEKINFYLKNTSTIEKKILMELQEVNTIWDKNSGKTVKMTYITVPSEFCGWVTAYIDAAVTGGRSYRIILSAEKDVSWAKACEQPVGTVVQYLYKCSGGCELKNKNIISALSYEEKDIPNFEHWNQVKRNPFNLAMSIFPESRPYDACNVNNGCAWPYKMPNIWISDKGLPQSLEFRYNSEIEFNIFQICFDTNLNLVHSRMPGLWKAPECVKHWRLFAETEEGYRLIYEEKDNFQRFRRISWGNRIRTKTIRLEILKTNSEEKKDARIYEVRIYNV